MDSKSTPLSPQNTEASLTPAYEILWRGATNLLLAILATLVTAVLGFLTPVEGHPEGMRDPGWNFPTGQCVLWLLLGWRSFIVHIHRAAQKYTNVKYRRDY